ncbi:hypothetical protein F0562_027879 [Nyssa sinensis]|uniref:Uncharacterized protein n=1 Tax=Nyssa sinensis TaxID=561372 RepID=A0A5J5B6P4_9ASTE|nr:hypothetical protein F0562_027879 [Nyssa sinensis]
MPPGVYGDNGSLMYLHGFGYAPYNPNSPTGTLVLAEGHNDQLYGAQYYQYPITYFQPITPTGGPYNRGLAAPTKSDISISAATDQTPLLVDTANGNSIGIINKGGTKGNNGAALELKIKFGMGACIKDLKPHTTELAQFIARELNVDISQVHLLNFTSKGHDSLTRWAIMPAGSVDYVSNATAMILRLTFMSASHTLFS